MIRFVIYILYCFSTVSCKLKWAFLIILSVIYPKQSVCLFIGLSEYFTHFHLLLQNHWAIFNLKLSTKHLLFNWRTMIFFKGMIICKNRKNTLTTIKLFRANFNQTWHNAFLGRWSSNLFRWRATPFSKGRWIVNVHLGL